MLEIVTHNARGDVIDGYSHFDWPALCEAVMCVDYGNDRTVAHYGGEPAVLAIPASCTAPNASPEPAAEHTANRALHDALHDAPPKNRVFRGRFSGGAGNRTRVRRASNQASFTCVVGEPHRHGL